MSKIVEFIKSYFDIKGDVDEAIVLITGVYIISLVILIHYVWIGKDMPHDIMTYMIAIWGGSVGSYVAKVFYYKGNNNDSNMGQ